MDILAALPKTPGMAPEALWAWLKRNGKAHPQELIRYKTTKLADPLTGIREKYAACNCTACGESWHTTITLPGEGGAYPYFDTEEGPRRNGETIHCPNCGTAALVAHEKRLDRWPIVKKAYPWEIRKAGGCVMFICWAVIHETGYDWESTIVEQRNAYVIDPGGHWHRFTAMDRSGYSSMSTMYYTGCWYEMARFQVADGNFSAILPHSADVYEGTPLENAKLELLEEQARLVQQYDEQIQAADNARFVHNLDANHCNVWLSNEPTGGHSIHPTQKPVDLLERAIRTHTKPGAVVCDFFAGSGSTGVAALKAGRRYILIEQSASYHEKGLAWLEETKSALCT